jgi:hypothetical protein
MNYFKEISSQFLYNSLSPNFKPGNLNGMHNILSHKNKMQFHFLHALQIKNDRVFMNATKVNQRRRGSATDKDSRESKQINQRLSEKRSVPE